MIMKSLNRVTFALTVGLSFILLNSVSSLAQSSADQLKPNNINTGYQNNEQDSFSGQSFNPFDLMHNMMLNRGGFDIEASNQNINRQANDFKAIQQQRLLEMLNQNQNSTLNNQEENNQVVPENPNQL